VLHPDSADQGGAGALPAEGRSPTPVDHPGRVQVQDDDVTIRVEPSWSWNYWRAAPGSSHSGGPAQARSGTIVLKIFDPCSTCFPPAMPADRYRDIKPRTSSCALRECGAGLRCGATPREHSASPTQPRPHRLEIAAYMAPEQALVLPTADGRAIFSPWPSCTTRSRARSSTRRHRGERRDRSTKAAPSVAHVAPTCQSRSSASSTRPCLRSRPALPGRTGDASRAQCVARGGSVLAN